MNNHLLLTVVFVAGVGAGWLGKTFLQPWPSEPTKIFSEDANNSITPRDSSTANISLATDSYAKDSGNASTKNVNFFDASPTIEQPKPSEKKTADYTFTELLNNRLYSEAMVLYQETTQQVGTSSAPLKVALLDHLRSLLETRNNSEFSELIEKYLSIYYDDIDVLLLLAKFNQTNGSYLETVNVYLLAKTYSYTDIDQANLTTHLNDFVTAIDSLYTNQKDWLSLINFYSHIDTSGLMTSSYQYGQALAYLGNGDQISATVQLEQLTTDALVGEQAAIALSKLSAPNSKITSIENTIQEKSEIIPLQQRGTQYLVNLNVGRQDTVNLLIDTGASLTTLTQASFYALRSNADAIEKDRRIFRTANGVVQGTVYVVPEITIGSYLLKDVDIAVLDFEMPDDINGLLGMNVLSQFRFQIDQENKALVLNRK